MKTNNGILFRAKALWVEEGEKNSKYFLNLEKRNYNTKNIKTLINEDGKEITELEDIIKEENNFYDNLYSSQLEKDQINNEFLLNMQKRNPQIK